jgi:CheY-like chemotaxis protein
LKILYVEDSEVSQRAMRRLVTKMGHTLVPASDAAQGYTLARTSLDLIMLDINLPDGNGLDLARRLRAEQIETPIIIVTAAVASYSNEDAIAAGCNGFVGKPLQFAAVQAAIQRCTAGDQEESARGIVK